MSSLSKIFGAHPVSLPEDPDYWVLHNGIEDILRFSAEDLVDFLEGDMIFDMFHAIAEKALLETDQEKKRFLDCFSHAMYEVLVPHQFILQQMSNVVDDEWEQNDGIWSAAFHSVSQYLKNSVPYMTVAAMSCKQEAPAHPSPGSWLK